MPKRTRPRSYDDDIEKYRKKLRKLERKKREKDLAEVEPQHNGDNQVTPPYVLDVEPIYATDDDDEPLEGLPQNPYASPRAENLQDFPPNQNHVGITLSPAEPQAGPSSAPDEPQPEPRVAPAEPQPGPGSAPDDQPSLTQPGSIITSEGPQEDNDRLIELDPDVLDILGDDPSSAVQYGPEIRKELANRLQHIAIEGLDKNVRKELLAKYLVPSNCTYIDAPKVNVQIKFYTESNAKRDKGIETKQKQMAIAISCLTDVINMQLNSKNKNNEMLQKLMDTARMLCDIQHSDSVTRRNFIQFAVKKDMSDHLSKTKIDSFLFGQGLSEALKAAKEVNRSASDLRPDAFNNRGSQKHPTTRPPPGKQSLNRRAPPPPRRPQGPPLQARSREPAALRAQYAPPPPPPPAPGYWSRPWSHQPPPPPPPPPPMNRRRHY